ncbi:hypothetical protein JCM4914_00940 [Streptomyces platensis subsp. malvinus]
MRSSGLDMVIGRTDIERTHSVAHTAAQRTWRAGKEPWDEAPLIAGRRR